MSGETSNDDDKGLTTGVYSAGLSYGYGVAEKGATTSFGRGAAKGGGSPLRLLKQLPSMIKMEIWADR